MFRERLYENSVKIQMSTDVGVQPILPPKKKTKAKQRYLKKKKERKKHKINASRGTDLMDDCVDIIPGPSQYDEEIANRSRTPESIKPPKKRLRTQHSPQLKMEQPRLKGSEEPHAEAEGAPKLPLFPVPTLPDAPSKSVLALQGLNQALVDAEIVLPSRVLPIPSGKDDGATGLSDRTRMRLKDIGITELFAVQTSLLPFLLSTQSSPRALYLPYDPPRDVCVSAPTGSGKTLAYVLPIIETLSSRVITRLRALIVLPTRDLVIQVRETFEVLSKGTGLKIGAVTGQHSFLQERSQVIGEKTRTLQGGSSKVDILICTPGRLIDHINGTPNFSLQHLRYLVIDEADRLLAQSFQNWLAQVLAATRLRGNTAIENSHSPCFKDHDDNFGLKPTFPLNDLMPDGVAPTFTPLPFPVVRIANLDQGMTSCQKLLFSATLTRDPSKIAALDLRDPKYFIVQGSDKGGSETDILDFVMEEFSMPSTLIERMIVSTSLQKPLMFFHLVHSHQVSNVLVFAKSAESTTRLVRLFEMFESARVGNHPVNPLVVRAYSSDLPVNKRKVILEQFRNQKIHVLVCSDLISRGIDINHVSHVVSYDVPVDMHKYVHRVGRTARAGKIGEAWTLVEEQEARYFKQMLKEAGHLENVKRLRISDEDLAPLAPHYEVALNKLKEFYTRQQT